MSTGRSTPPAGYGMTAPTHASMVDALTHCFSLDEATALWANACCTAGVPADVIPGDVTELRRAADALISQGGLVGTCAQGLRIRLLTYVALSRHPNTPHTAAQ